MPPHAETLLALQAESLRGPVIAKPLTPASASSTHPTSVRPAISWSTFGSADFMRVP